MILSVTATTDCIGTLRAGENVFKCALGRSGIVQHKREGDGATPAGTFPLRELLYRPDRISKPASNLPIRALSPDEGWCDAPDDLNYNRPVQLPYRASAETLWREDGVYDLIVVIGYNDAPPQPGLGSAIFLHCAAPGLAPTEGCVALAANDLTAVISMLAPGSAIQVLLP